MSKFIYFLICSLLVAILIGCAKNASFRTETEEDKKTNFIISQVLSKYNDGEFNGQHGLDTTKMTEKELKILLTSSSDGFEVTIPFQKLAVIPDKNKYFVGLIMSHENDTTELVWLNKVIEYSSGNLIYSKGISHPYILLSKIKAKDATAFEQSYYVCEIYIPENFLFEESFINKNTEIVGKNNKQESINMIIN